jgi:hypothetical protein
LLSVSIKIIITLNVNWKSTATPVEVNAWLDTEDLPKFGKIEPSG